MEWEITGLRKAGVWPRKKLSSKAVRVRVAIVRGAAVPTDHWCRGAIVLGTVDPTERRCIVAAAGGSATTKAQPPASVKGRAALRPAVVLCATLPSAFRCRASAGKGIVAEGKPLPAVR